MKPFNRQELIGVVLISLVVFSATWFNLKVAIRRSRDAQRKADLGAISDALGLYNQDFGFFPPSDNGKIKACKADNFDEIVSALSKETFSLNKFFEGLRSCDWGKESLIDLTDSGRTPYLTPIPQDSENSKGFSYLYFSNTRRYQIYAYLEGGRDEAGFSAAIVERNLACGKNICNFGKSYAETPLDKSIEEYEQELMEKSKTGSP